MVKGNSRYINQNKTNSAFATVSPTYDLSANSAFPTSTSFLTALVGVVLPEDSRTTIVTLAALPTEYNGHNTLSDYGSNSDQTKDNSVDVNGSQDDSNNSTDNGDDNGDDNEDNSLEDQDDENGEDQDYEDGENQDDEDGEDQDDEDGEDQNDEDDDDQNDEDDDDQNDEDGDDKDNEEDGNISATSQDNDDRISTTGTVPETPSPISDPSIFGGSELSVSNSVSNKALGIGLGVGIGCIAALGLAGMLFHNRRKKQQEAIIEDQKIETRWTHRGFREVVASTVSNLPRTPSQRSRASAGH